MNNPLIDHIRKYSTPITNDDYMDYLVEQIGEAKIVLLGESSHGTSEFYRIRAQLSQKLIEEKGFTIIAVEGDWPSCQAINQFIKDPNIQSSSHEILQNFKRWPTWMWANEEIEHLIDWLKSYNQTTINKVGFYGLDVYSLWESMDEIIAYLEKSGSSDLDLAKKAFSCFEPFNRQPERYAVSSSLYSEGCINEVTKLLASIRQNKELYASGIESSLNLEINALVAANAENYYRTMVTSDTASWNIRDQHMVEVLNKIRSFFGHDSKMIVWEHNTHIGDARATDMKDEGMVNVGQLVREQQESSNDVYIVGFGTYKGTVIAAEEWGVNFERMVVPPAKEDSWEYMMHTALAQDQLLIFNDQNKSYFQTRIGHRAIGVVYQPQYEQYGNYVPSVMSDRYDAFVFIDSTNALHPLTLQSVYL